MEAVGAPDGVDGEHDDVYDARKTERALRARLLASQQRERDARKMADDARARLKLLDQQIHSPADAAYPLLQARRKLEHVLERSKELESERDAHANQARVEALRASMLASEVAALENSRAEERDAASALRAAERIEAERLHSAERAQLALLLEAERAASRELVSRLELELSEERAAVREMAELADAEATWQVHLLSGELKHTESELASARTRLRIEASLLAEKASVAAIERRLLLHELHLVDHGLSGGRTGAHASLRDEAAAVTLMARELACEEARAEQLSKKLRVAPAAEARAAAESLARELGREEDVVGRLKAALEVVPAAETTVATPVAGGFHDAAFGGADVFAAGSYADAVTAYTDDVANADARETDDTTDVITEPSQLVACTASFATGGVPFESLEPREGASSLQRRGWLDELWKRSDGSDALILSRSVAGLLLDAPPAVPSEPLPRAAPVRRPWRDRPSSAQLAHFEERLSELSAQIRAGSVPAVGAAAVLRSSRESCRTHEAIERLKQGANFA